MHERVRRDESMDSPRELTTADSATRHERTCLRTHQPSWRVAGQPVTTPEVAPAAGDIDGDVDRHDDVVPGGGNARGRRQYGAHCGRGWGTGP
jgi:hypothetical protein